MTYIIFVALLFLAIVSGVVYLMVRYLGNNSEQPSTNLNEMSETRTVKKAKYTHLTKAVIIAIICVGALLPLSMVMDMTSDRERIYHRVVKDIGHSWGEKLILSGPVLVVPYSYYVLREELSPDGKTVNKTKDIRQNELVILPKKLEQNLVLNHDFRNRGIYQSLVYNTTLLGKVDFNPPQIEIDNVIGYDMKRARLVFGVSSNKAIDKVHNIKLNGSSVKLAGSLMSGTKLNVDNLNQGF